MFDIKRYTMYAGGDWVSHEPDDKGDWVKFADMVPLLEIVETAARVAVAIDKLFKPVTVNIKLDIGEDDNFLDKVIDSANEAKD